MTISELTKMAKRIHDAEGWKLGSGSTRETRNAFWERVLGCAHWGHPVYNPTPDPQWHSKDPDGPTGGRPATDDVAVSMPSRNAWDCIPGVGADGYRFEADRSPFFLSVEQFVFVPAKPSGAGFPEPVIPTQPSHNNPAPAPKIPAYESIGGDNFFRTSVGAPLAADYAEAGQQLNDGSAVWVSRTIYTLVTAHLKGGTVDAASICKKQRNEWRGALGLPPL